MVLFLPTEKHYVYIFKNSIRFTCLKLSWNNLLNPSKFNPN